MLSTSSGIAVDGELTGHSQSSLNDSHLRRKEHPSYIYTIDDDSSDSSTLNRVYSEQFKYLQVSVTVFTVA